MRILKINNYLSKRDLEKKTNSQKSIADFKDWQIIYSVSINQGKKAIEIADILGVKETKIRQTVQKYNKLGVSWKDNVRRGGRREKRCIMPLENEKIFLQSIEVDALSGQIINYQQIKSKLEKYVNRSVSDDYIWDMFKRHGWSKKTPRQSHPLGNKTEQEEYKKNSLKIWLPNH